MNQKLKILVFSAGTRRTRFNIRGEKYCFQLSLGAAYKQRQARGAMAFISPMSTRDMFMANLTQINDQLLPEKCDGTGDMGFDCFN